MKKLGALLLALLFLSLKVFADPVVDQKIDKEYSAATVLLIDSQKGYLGISYENEETGKQAKQAFKVNENEASVRDVLNHYSDFSAIKFGDRVDIYTQIDSKGKETVYDILDYNLNPNE